MEEVARGEEFVQAGVSALPIVMVTESMAVRC